jgi:3-dehydroquinate synthase
MTEDLLVNLGERSYRIHFGADLTSAVRTAVERFAAEKRKVVVLTDTNLEQAQPTALRAMAAGAPVFSVAPGESAKSIAGFSTALDFLGAERVDRRGVLLAVGGGVIGDLDGYVAASWLRGIDFVQVPTTLLAMVDSSVGGKTGINIAAGKNLVGAFHQPRAVYISTDLLRSLPAREFAAGMAEVIKYGLLGDLSLFEALERAPLTVTSAHLADTIRRCCAAKARVVEADERETAANDGRALLNLGHTFGHAIENVAGYGTYLHGEAVSIGLHAAAHLSRELGCISENDVTRIVSVLRAHQLPTGLSAPLPYAKLHEAMLRDKKARAGGLRFVVMKQLGRAATQSDIPPELVQRSFCAVGAGA